MDVAVEVSVVVVVAVVVEASVVGGSPGAGLSSLSLKASIEVAVTVESPRVFHS